ncbi:RsmF rRNA methyltransferase first C-terminal domain-containing protein [Deinococcus yavapaiensis]|uniref:NOL1/NOP2/sun family putative RNA methylase n=1 Tax=Deinococcus yavapaiensis KR-236 TaxID=694435 RepID=A0A318SEY3_9DEIO|nr:RsmF rRNA methyltransferase first C-terminal domain-containing protein [Deinococcus yavapaiensis]PYE56357.1 NOL1/NOP2/sun family putative RNA methylase [Deinococcus yavapaiensis KR-236]
MADSKLPSAFLARVEGQLGDDFAAFCAALERGERAAGLRVNPLKSARLPFGALDAVPWEPSGFYVPPDVRPGAHPLHWAGAYYVQEPSAMAVARIVDPAPGERVLDLAAAPGGKTTHLAALMNGAGLVVANEVTPSRVGKLLENVERWGVPIVVTNESVEKLARAWPEGFDRVLLDAPCSGEGMFRKDDEAVRTWTPRRPAQLASLQRDLLRSAAELVRSGGVLVYSTCTFSREENEGVIEDFLKRHVGWKLEDAALHSDFDVVMGAAVRLWPHRVRGEGHFVAKLRAPGNEDAERHAGDLQAASRAVRRTWDAFASQHGTSDVPGTIIERSGHLYAVSEDAPDFTGVKVRAPGLYLGEVKGERFLPARALAQWHALAATSTLSFDADVHRTVLSSLDRGEAVSFDAPEGWHVATVQDLGLTWVQSKKGALRPTKARW